MTLPISHYSFGGGRGSLQRMTRWKLTTLSISLSLFVSPVDTLELLRNCPVLSSNLCFFESICRVTSRKQNTKLNIHRFPFTFDVSTYSPPFWKTIEKGLNWCNGMISTDIAAHKRITMQFRDIFSSTVSIWNREVAQTNVMHSVPLPSS
jgi:hypothetical protein